MSAFKCISVLEVQKIMDTRDAIIADIRDAGSFSNGHIPGAVHVQDQNVESFIQETEKQKPLICYCYHGHSSQRAAAFFADRGFKEVYSMDGGYEEWKKNPT